MSRSVALPVCLVLGLTLTSATAFGQDAKTPANKSTDQQLIVGDWYEVTIERQGISQPISGYLIEADADWIVLAELKGFATARGIPWLYELPYIGGAFGQTKQWVEKNYSWLPRQAVRIEKHELREGHKPPFDGVAPKLEGRCVVSYIEQQKRKLYHGEVKNVSTNQIEFKLHEWETVSRPKSRASRLPVIGYLFNKSYIVTREVEKPIAVADILCIERRFPCDPPDLQASAKK